MIEQAKNLPPAPYKIPLFDRTGQMDSTWIKWFQVIWTRVGGSTGETIYDAADIAAATAASEAQLFAIKSDLEERLQGILLSFIEQIRDQVEDFTALISNESAFVALQQQLNDVIKQSDYIQFNTSTSLSTVPGMLTWDDADGTLQLGLKGGNVTLQLGQEMVMRGYNRTGATIPNGTVVYVLGAHANELEVAVASNTSHTLANSTIGVATEDIPNNRDAFFTTHGEIHDLNTNAFNEGDELWLGVAGAMTNVMPTSPTQKVMIGYVVRKHPTQGIIFVKPDPKGDLSDLSDISATAPTNGQALTWVSANSRWEPSTPAGGTVTSVGLTVPSFLSITGSPITSSGTLTVSYSGTALPVLNGGTGTTTSTGTGSVVLSSSPALTTPNIGAAVGTSLSLAGGHILNTYDVAGSALIRVTNPNTGTSADARVIATNGTVTAGVIMRGTAFTSQANHALLYVTGANPLYFNQNSTNRMGIDTSGNFTYISTGKLGYGTGAGGAVTQSTSKSTSVTLNKGAGQITMNAAALAANTIVTFTLTNSVITAMDTVIIHRSSGGTAAAYNVWVDSVAAGSAVIAVQNITAGSLSEAVVLNFAVIAGANA
jgi:hypothetical protein